MLQLYVNYPITNDSYGIKKRSIYFVRLRESRVGLERPETLFFYVYSNFIASMFAAIDLPVLTSVIFSFLLESQHGSSS